VNRILLVLAILLAPRLGHAEQVGVVVTGEPTMQPRLVRQIEGWLKSHGNELVAVPLPADAINTLIDCFVIEDEGCARNVIDKRGRANVIVFARVEVQAGGDIEKTVTVTAYWFEKGQKAVSARRFCERCTEATLGKTAEELMASLIQAAPHVTGRLQVTSDPAGATCAIDGKPAGPTPLDQDVSPGPHEITVHRENHRVATRSVTVKPGEVSKVDVQLVEIGGGNRSRLLPVITMGVGGAMVATGIVMFAIDQDKGPQEPLFIRDTAPAGVAIGAAGIAVVVGGYLWYRMTGAHSQPVAAIGHDTTYIGWLGRF